MNQIVIVRQRKKINIFLGLFIAVLLSWISIELSDEFKRAYEARKPLKAKHIRLKRGDEEIIFLYENNNWLVTQPYNHKASQTVIKTLLSLLQNGCRSINEPPARLPQIYADITVDEAIYQIGELNHASDEIYMLHDNKWQLCDKLLVSMGLSPAINFIDKALYEGTLTEIVGDFGRLKDFNGIDFSVLEIAPAELDELPKNVISKLTFIADDRRSYLTFLSENKQHLLLFDQKKSVIYVLAKNHKINAVIGL